MKENRKEEKREEDGDGSQHFLTSFSGFSHEREKMEMEMDPNTFLQKFLFPT